MSLQTGIDDAQREFGKQEVIVLKESLEYAMFLKRVFSHYKQEVTLLNKRQKLSLSRFHKVKRVFPI